MSRRPDQMSFFPRPQAVMGLGGRRVHFMENALDCWLEALTQASADNQVRFDAGDFRFLYEPLHDAMIEPYVANPSERMVEAVEMASQRPALAFEVFSDETGQRVQKLTEKVRNLDYVHAWAILWPLWCFRENCKGLDPARVEWWKMEFVRGHAQQRGKR
jgi:hypothetical protein